ALFAALVSNACVSSLTPFDDAFIECSTDDDCPEDLRCIAALQRCGASGNLAPVVQVGAISRSVDTVRIPVNVIDADLDEVQLELQINSGSGFETVPTEPASVVPSAEGSDLELLWDAATTFGDSAYRSGLSPG
ncbi:MAG: hypothetical protein AAFQ82_07690, partial [Myxococcota bacterium]